MSSISIHKFLNRHHLTGKHLRRWLKAERNVVATVVVAAVVTGVLSVMLLHWLFVSVPVTQSAGKLAYGLGYDLVVRSVSQDTTGQYPFSPGDGYRFYIVDVKLTNRDTTGHWFAPVIQTYLRDAQGDTFTMSPDFLKTPIQAGSLSPGQSAAGQLSYLVSNNATDVRFYFDPAWRDGGPVSVFLPAPGR